MVMAAADAGLDGVGVADHCMLPDREGLAVGRALSGSNLDLTHERRRYAIELVREEVDIEVYDAVEMDYLPGDNELIADFLAVADFDYVIGSVHEVDGMNVHFADHLRDADEATRRAHVDEYFDNLEALIRSGLFDIAAHPDIVERNEALRGLATEEHYHQIATAFDETDTIPELNAGRVTEAYGAFHPNEAFLDVLCEYDIPITTGTDSHRPEAITPRVEHISEAFERRGLTPATPFDA